MMEAGRELDGLVAEKVMGYAVKRVTRKIGNTGNLKTGETHDVYDTDWYLLETNGETMMVHGPLMHGYGPARVAHYSTDIAAAWQVAEAMRIAIVPEMVFHQKPSIDGFSARVCSQNHPEGRAWAKTAPLAICLAALKAVGVEV
ncbi:MAG: hypothetical protein WC648_05090 [Candidatus Paceibacterota bacterium]|jgi:hypothetical protein